MLLWSVVFDLSTIATVDITKTWHHCHCYCGLVTHMQDMYCTCALYMYSVLVLCT